MKRVRSICFHALSALSFTALVAVLTLWSRTHIWSEEFVRGRTWRVGDTVYSRWHALTSFDGVLRFYRGHEQRRAAPNEAPPPAKVDYLHRRGVPIAPRPGTYEYINALGFGYFIKRSPPTREATVRGWYFPHWFALLITLVLPCAWGRWLFVRLRRYDRITRGCCPECGYDLQASPERCPECGTSRNASAKTLEG